MKTLILLIAIGTVFFVACEKKADAVVQQSLFEQISNAAKYSFYKNDSSVLPSAPQSAHNAFFRVRFNSIAAAALTESGKLPVNGSFPEGSIIVKDLYNQQNGNIVLYSVLKKESGNANSNTGWLWAEYDTSGKEIYAIVSKGDGCVNCHSVNSRDKVRLFDLF
jgi:hypothetical protein